MSRVLGWLVMLLKHYLGHAIQKYVFGHMRTTKAQISLCIRLHCSLAELLDATECMNGEQRPCIG